MLPWLLVSNSWLVPVSEILKRPNPGVVFSKFDKSGKCPYTLVVWHVFSFPDVDCRSLALSLLFPSSLHANPTSFSCHIVIFLSVHLASSLSYIFLFIVLSIL